jgi:hypothetical protein
MVAAGLPLLLAAVVVDMGIEGKKEMEGPYKEMRNGNDTMM